MHRPTRRSTLLTAAVAVAATATAIAGPTHAATITVSYDVGYADVIVNGYGTTGMGTFRLDDGGTGQVALCIEADTAHSTVDGAYRRVANRVASAELDTLLWWLSRHADVDDDTGLAAAALAWYYADAQRTIGVPVWADGSRGFAPIGPLAPNAWDALPRFSSSFPVGLARSGVHLDAAERRLAELHRLAVAWRGPWSLRAVEHDFRLTGPGGPIAGHPVIVRVVWPGGDVDRTLTTDDDGRVDTDLPVLPDGATVTAHTEAPGVHVEWDGDGAVQRMATATNQVVRARVDVPPLPRHLELRKRSTDPTLGVGGVVFELRDEQGVLVERVTTDAAGAADFAAFDPAGHPGPYTLDEVDTPPTLVPLDEPITLTRLSHDAAAPTVVMVDNAPRTAAVEVRKTLSEPDLGPSDRSGFEFTLRRAADGATRRLVTGADGSARVDEVAAGAYELCETGTPEWAAGFTDGGCHTLVVDGAALASGRVELEYLNLAPVAGIDTAVVDPADGDRVLLHDADVVVDEVVLTDLVPGTRYRLVADVRTTDGEVIGSPVERVVDAIADRGRLTVELPFDGGPGTFVVTERLLVGDRVVARHESLDDPDQTFVVPPPPTTTTTTTTTTTSTPTTSTTASTTTTVPAWPSTSTTSTTSAPLPAPERGAESVVETPSTSAPTTSTSTSMPPPTLPRTGGSAGDVLRWADMGFAVGVGLVALAGLAPRRGRAGRSTRPARRGSP